MMSLLIGDDFTSEEYAHVLTLLRQAVDAGNEALLRAILLDSLNVILAALKIAVQEAA